MTPGGPDTASATIDAWLAGPEGNLRYRRLLLHASSLTGDPARGEDLVQDAYLRIKSGDRAWDPTKTPKELLGHMLMVIDSLFSIDINTVRSETERSYANPGKAKKRVRAAEASAEASALEVLVSLDSEKEGDEWVGRVRGAVKPGSLEEKIVVESQRGHESVEEQVAATGATHDEVKKARKNLRYLVQTRMGAAVAKLAPAVARGEAKERDKPKGGGSETEPEGAA